MILVQSAKLLLACQFSIVTVAVLCRGICLVDFSSHRFACMDKWHDAI
jgi:hypothetical protein